jgi:hypothetical protein
MDGVAAIDSITPSPPSDIAGIRCVGHRKPFPLTMKLSNRSALHQIFTSTSLVSHKLFLNAIKPTEVLTNGDAHDYERREIS